MAAAMIAAKMADSLASNRFGVGSGKTENPTPSAPKPTITPAAGVPKPASSAPPAANPRRPASQVPGVDPVFCAR